MKSSAAVLRGQHTVVYKLCNIFGSLWRHCEAICIDQGLRLVGRVPGVKMLNKTEQSDRAPNPNEKPEDCYCSALPKGSGLCLPRYTRWLAGSARKQSGRAGRWRVSPSG